MDELSPKVLRLGRSPAGCFVAANPLAWPAHATTTAEACGVLTAAHRKEQSKSSENGPPGQKVSHQTVTMMQLQAEAAVNKQSVKKGDSSRRHR